MTTNTTDTIESPRPDAKSDPESELPIASKTSPGVGAAHATPEPDLQSPINVRHVALVARLRELRADMDVDAIEAGDKLKAKLSELSHIIEGGIVDGWASLGNNVKSRLERWLVESARHLPTQNTEAVIAAHSTVNADRAQA
jgi:hypothetical protein